MLLEDSALRLIHDSFARPRYLQPRHTVVQPHNGMNRRLYTVVIVPQPYIPYRSLHHPPPPKKKKKKNAVYCMDAERL